MQRREHINNSAEDVVKLEILLDGQIHKLLELGQQDIAKLYRRKKEEREVSISSFISTHRYYFDIFPGKMFAFTAL